MPATLLPPCCTQLLTLCKRHAEACEQTSRADAVRACHTWYRVSRCKCCCKSAIAVRAALLSTACRGHAVKLIYAGSPLLPCHGFFVRKCCSQHTACRNMLTGAACHTASAQRTHLEALHWPVLRPHAPDHLLQQHISRGQGRGWRAMQTWQRLRVHESLHARPPAPLPARQSLKPPTGPAS